MPLEYACSPNPEVCAVFKLLVPARHASDLPAAFVITQRTEYKPESIDGTHFCSLCNSHFIKKYICLKNVLIPILLNDFQSVIRHGSVV